MTHFHYNPPASTLVRDVERHYNVIAEFEEMGAPTLFLFSSFWGRQKELFFELKTSELNNEQQLVLFHPHKVLES